MLAAHRSCQCTLMIDGVLTSTKPDGPRQDARGGQGDWRGGENEGGPPHPGRHISTHDLGDDGGKRDQHEQCDQPVHRPSRRSHPPVVARDRGEHRLRQLTLTTPQRLNVEHEVEPEDRKQEPSTGSRESIHIAIIPNGPDESRFPDCHYRDAVAEYS